MAAAVANDYESLMLVGILNGAFMLTSDLAKNLSKKGLNNLQIDFMRVDSYGNGEVSSRAPKIMSDLKLPIEGKNVLVVEDIAETGYSLDLLRELLSTRNPLSLEILALLSKEERREVSVPIKYRGFNIPDKFVFGYGIDAGEEGRQLPYIAYKTG
ncbi:MAG: hypoxanthine phosphoribosyltransferase [bacterium]